MNDIFRTVISLSVSASCIGIILLVLKPLYRNRLTKTWQYYIWLIVLARLLIPFSPAITLPEAWTPVTPDIIAETTASAETAPNETTPNETEMPLSAAVPENRTDDLKRIPFTPPLDYVWLCWLAIAVLLLIAKTAMYHHCVNSLKKKTTRITDERILSIYAAACASVNAKRAPDIVSGDVPSPMLVGVIRPLIILPAGYSCADNNLELILKHELTHHKRFDIALKWILQITACLHWFNPFVYIFKKEINKNCELSCDEAVLNTMDSTDYRTYGDALISNIVTAKNKVAAVALSGDGKVIKSRLEAILNKKTATKKNLTISLIFAVVLIAGALLTGGLLANTTAADIGQEASSHSITYFIDNHIHVQGAGDVGIIYNTQPPFILTSEQWLEIRALFNEAAWIETEAVELLNVNMETGFLSFFGQHETIAFFVSEQIVRTMEYAPEIEGYPKIVNRYFRIPAEIAAAIEAKASIFAAAYELPPEPLGG